MNDLFTTRTYSPNIDNPGSLNIVIESNNDQIYYLMVSNSVNIESQNPTVNIPGTAYGKLPAGRAPVGKRFLEIMATKIFGNPIASYAFANVVDYIGDIEIKTTQIGNSQVIDIIEYEYSLPAQSLVYGLHTSYATYSRNFYDQYILIGKLAGDQSAKQAQNDSSSTTSFNMQNIEMDIPIYFQGNMQNPTGGLLPDSFWDLYIPPQVGGNIVSQTGQYNIPLILRLHD
jgi:hypothetical protein